MRTFQSRSALIEPGQEREVFFSLPALLTFIRCDLCPESFAAFDVLACQHVPASMMQRENRVPPKMRQSHAIRLLLRNHTAEPRTALVIIDVDVDLAVMSKNLESVAERFNREVFAARRRRLLS